MNSSVFKLAFDGMGNLYAGGFFTTAGGVSANRIAKWNGSNWSALGLGVDGLARALTFDGMGNLYAGGDFTTAGGVSANRVAKWDGSNWSALGSGMNDRVFALATDKSGQLFAGGFFTTAGGVSANRIAKWDGVSWSALGSGMEGGFFGSPPTVRALAIDNAGILYAGGNFATAGGLGGSPRIAKWNGSSWSPLGVGINDTVHALAFDSAGNLFAGGEFTAAGAGSALRIAKWDSSTWSALGSGLDSSVSALVVDGVGNVYVGGSVPTAGGVSAGRITKWDGSNWSVLGVGLGSISGLGSTVLALAFDSAGNLYAGGDFTTAGAVSANRIAKWDGSSWSALSSGVDGFIRELAFDSTGNLYAGGVFTTAGGVSASRIAKWDGSSWSALGPGVNNQVWTLTFDNGGNLYAGGDFTTAGGVTANRIAKWDGSSWSALGSGMNSSVLALAFDSTGNLYAGGVFTTAGGVSASELARWDGSTWSALGSGLSGANGSVFALAFDSVGNFYAGGGFTTAGGVSANRIAKWDGSTWSALGSGMNNSQVVALAIDRADKLYAGGNFTAAGGKVSRSAAYANPVTEANHAPTLTSVNTLTGGTEDTPFTITYAVLAGAANEGDVDGAPISFRVEGVSSGTLTKNGLPITPGSTLLGSGESWVWTPAPNANGTLNAFTIRAWDGNLASASAVQVQVSVAPLNDPPTLTSVNTLTGASEDTAFTITYATLQAAADEADFDSDPISFRAEAVSNGTLTKNGITVTAGATLVSSGESWVWTPDADANGTLNAFTIRAWDGNLASASSVQVRVSVAAVNDAPIALSDAYTTNEDLPLNIATPGILSNDSDGEGTALTPVLGAGPSHGTLTLNADGSFSYVPAANFNGTDSFTYKAKELQGSIVWTSMGQSGVDIQSVAISPAWPGDATILLGGINRFLRSSDGGATWALTVPPSAFDHHYSALALSPLTTMAPLRLPAHPSLAVAAGSANALWHSTVIGFGPISARVGAIVSTTLTVRICVLVFTPSLTV